jgi:hypothetical protein
MARIKKYGDILPQKLSSYQVFITDTNPKSDYFRITEFKDTFTGGKNGFYIEGSEYLKPSSELKIQILDVNGNPIYYEPLKSAIQYTNGPSIPVAVYIYEDTPVGVASITILGELDSYTDDYGNTLQIPSEWVDAYNVRWHREFKVIPTLRNEDGVIFYKQPKATITEITRPLYVTTTTSTTQSGSVSGIPISPLENQSVLNYNDTTSYKLRISGSSVWSTDMIGQYVNIPSLSYSAKISEVINSSEVIVTQPYTSSGEFVSTFSNQPYSVDYSYTSISGSSSLTGSFAKIYLTDLETAVGDVARVKVFRKSQSQLHDYEFVEDIQLESTELLVDLDASETIKQTYGLFTPNVLNTYWTSSNDMTAEFNQSYLYNSAKLVATQPKTPFYTKNIIDGLTSGVEHTLNFNLRASGSNNGSVRIYLSGSNTVSGSFLGSAITQDIVQLSAESSYYQKTNISENLIVGNITNAKLYFEVTGDTQWFISDVSLKASQETSFSPDSLTIIESLPRTLSSETFDFKFQFYDINNNYIPTDIDTSHTFTLGNISTNTIIYDLDSRIFTDTTGKIVKPPLTGSASGLYTGQTHLGFYANGQWKTYMADNGNFYLTGSNNGGYLFWDAAEETLNVMGTIYATAGNIGNWKITSGSIVSPNDRVVLTPTASAPGMEIYDSSLVKRVEVIQGSLYTPTEALIVGAFDASGTEMGITLNSGNPNFQRVVYGGELAVSTTLDSGQYSGVITVNTFQLFGLLSSGVSNLSVSSSLYLSVYKLNTNTSNSTTDETLIYSDNRSISFFPYDRYDIPSISTAVSIDSSQYDYYEFTLIVSQSAHYDSGYDCYISTLFTADTLPTQLEKDQNITQITDDGIQVITSANQYIRFDRDETTNTVLISKGKSEFYSNDKLIPAIVAYSTTGADAIVVSGSLRSTGNISISDSDGANYFQANRGAVNSTLLGVFSGDNTPSAYNLNSIGYGAGQRASVAYDSNFIGTNSGRDASNAYVSNFIGKKAGDTAYSASNSNFIGEEAGKDAYYASQSIFIGDSAGQRAASASYSTLIGYHAGFSPSSTLNTIGSNNIIIGTNISLPPGTKNAMNLGGTIFVTGSYATTTGNPKTDAVTTAKVGVATSTPNYTLDVNGTVNVTGSIRLNPTVDPDPLGLQSTNTFLFVSASNTALKDDLYIRQDGNLVKWKWVEGQLGSGLIYGGTLSVVGSGSVLISSGSGLLFTSNATTGSELNPIIQQVNWPAQTINVSPYTASYQATYIYIDSNGVAQQQHDTFFSETQYRQSIPLGMINHTGRDLVTSIANNVKTTYNQSSQAYSFMNAFGPLKLSGLTVSAQSTGLSLNVSSGESFILGGFYQQYPDRISTKATDTVYTASLARVYRNNSGGFNTDNNGGSFYTVIDVSHYDNGSGTLDTVKSNEWTIQRVFFNPFTLRAHVYYGGTLYASLSSALANLSTDSFTEAAYSTHQYVFVGYIVARGNATNLSDTVNNTIVPAGLFRSTAASGGGGGGGATTLDGLSDVTITSATNGQALIYNSGVWVNGNPTSASYASNADLLDGKDSTTFATTGSNTFIGNQIFSNGTIDINGYLRYSNDNFQLYNIAEGESPFNIISSSATFNVPVDIKRITTITGSLNVSGGITGSLLGTASYATNTLSASNADLLDGYHASVFATTGSNTFIGNQTITGSLTISGILTAKEFHTQYVSASIIYASGSSKFGDTADDVMQVTGSLRVNGSITGSLLGTSSYAINTVSASNADLLDGKDSSIFATTGSNIFNGTQIITGSIQTSGDVILSTNGASISSVIGSSTSYLDGESLIFNTNTIPNYHTTVYAGGLSMDYGSGYTFYGINYDSSNLYISSEGSIRLTTAPYDTPTLFANPSTYSVGINKDTTNATLDVNGNAIITGSLTTTDAVYAQGSTYGEDITLAGNSIHSNNSVYISDPFGNIITTDYTEGININPDNSFSQVIIGSLMEGNISNFVVTGKTIVYGGITGSILGTASYASNADLLDGLHASVFATTGSNIFNGDQIITGSIKTFSGSIYTSNTTNISQYGLVYKDGIRFLHNFNYGNNGTITTDGFNTFLGVYAGNLTMGSTATNTYEASYNTAVGVYSLTSLTKGYYNIGIGPYSGDAITTGASNITIGASAATSTTTGISNIAIGSLTLESNVAGNYGLAIGEQSQRYVTSSATSWTNYNTSVGYQSLRGSITAVNNTGNFNTALGYTTLQLNSVGGENTAIGTSALSVNTVGSYNTAVGTYALQVSSEGSQNTAIGRTSLYQNTSGSSNVAIGVAALRENRYGNFGVAIGNESQRYVSSSTSTWTNTNTSIGYQSLMGSSTPANNSGLDNTAVGYQSMYVNTSGGNNTSIGRDALSLNTTGTDNVGLGHFALRANTIGNQNTAVGRASNYLNKIGSGNVTLGYYSMLDAISGSYNTAIGYESLRANVAGNNGVAVGYQSQRYVTSSAVAWTNYNTSIGYQSLRGSTTAANNTGNYNTAVGYTSMLSNTTANYNTAVGHAAGYLTTTGGWNSFYGYHSARNNLTGVANTAIGPEALFANVSGSYNIAIGNSALYSSVVGGRAVAIGHESQMYASSSLSAWDNYNVSVGYNALKGSATPSDNKGNYNTAIGSVALFRNSTGGDNTSVGYGSLYNNTTGYYNIAIGSLALYSNQSGVVNTAIGRGALFNITNTSNNVAIGNDAGRYDSGSANLTALSNSVLLGVNTKASASSDTNEIVIGYDATGNGSNSVTLGNTSITKTILRGNVGIGTPNPIVKLDVNGNAIVTGSLTTTSTLKVQNGSSVYFQVNPIIDNLLAIGVNAGNGATNAPYSNFLGLNAGDNATNASYSNFLGESAGINATNAANSNFLGHYTGYGALSAYDSNFLGYAAGDSATNAFYSNFFGNSAGSSATNASYSNFIGSSAGYNATDASNSNFIGTYAGESAVGAVSSNFIGNGAGSGASNPIYPDYSNFIGNYAGSYTGITGGYGDGFSSNLIGNYAGYSATEAYKSNFIGFHAGEGAGYAHDSNFIGTNAGIAGSNPTYADYSNFIGNSAGLQVAETGGYTNGFSSNFIGNLTGNGAVEAYHSNFIGYSAGVGSVYANNSNFIGEQSGYAASNAHDSNFIGTYAGMSAINASYCTLIGYNVGYDTSAGSNSIGTNNVIIGTNISLPAGTANAMNLGGVIFVTGSYGTTTGNPKTDAVTTAKVGIGKSTPNSTLDVNGNLIVTGSITATIPTSNPYFVQGILAGNQSISTGSDTVISFVDQYDDKSWWDPSTKRFTPNVAGYYNISVGSWLENPGTSTGQCNIQLRKNGATIMIVQLPLSNTSGISLTGTRIVYFNGSTDYADFTYYHNAGSSKNLLQGTSDSSGTWFYAVLLAM